MTQPTQKAPGEYNPSIMLYKSVTPRATKSQVEGNMTTSRQEALQPKYLLCQNSQSPKQQREKLDFKIHLFLTTNFSSDPAVVSVRLKGTYMSHICTGSILKVCRKLRNVIIYFIIHGVDVVSRHVIEIICSFL